VGNELAVVAHVKAPRMTMFGSTCLEQWTYNTKMYTRCTTDPDPNGMQGQEWCMIDVTGMPTNSDLKNWDRCDNKLDTDSLRSGIVTNQRTEITTTTSVTTMLERIQPIVANAMAKFSAVVTSQVSILTQVQGLASQMFLLQTEMSELARIKAAII